jgi:hypothetical protein
MDSLIVSAARALAAGDPLGALKRVALRDDPPALALRGIAMAQLGDYERARRLLRRAARGFGARERLAQARCQVAEAEVALAARDLTRRMPTLDAATATLDALGDHANALHARLIWARRQLLVGEVEAAEQTLAAVTAATATAPPPLAARAELTRAEIALRVELGRLRGALRPLACIEATSRGFALTPIQAPAVVVLAPPIAGPAGSIVALLESGESWSTSALACALGSSQRTVQRALSQLQGSAAVRAVGRGPSRRWLAPALGGFATTLLLPGALA